VSATLARSANGDDGSGQLTLEDTMPLENQRDPEPKPEAEITAGGHPSAVKPADEQAAGKVAGWAITGAVLGGLAGIAIATAIYFIGTGGEYGVGLWTAMFGGFFVGAAAGGIIMGRLKLDDRAVTEPTYRNIRTVRGRHGDQRR
jgi:hypothetical protein